MAMGMSECAKAWCTHGPRAAAAGESVRPKPRTSVTHGATASPFRHVRRSRTLGALFPFAPFLERRAEEHHHGDCTRHELSERACMINASVMWFGCFGMPLSSSRDGDGIKSCRIPLERLAVPYRGNSLVRPGTFSVTAHTNNYASDYGCCLAMTMQESSKNRMVTASPQKNRQALAFPLPACVGQGLPSST
jgi:hypothetical protein